MWFFPIFLCWGSFLNVVGYRIIRGTSIVAPRSYCPHCKTTIAWYDNIPFISWIMLDARCRSCKKSISILYPCIELLSALSLTALLMIVPLPYFFSYFLFFSALMVTIRTDLETMLISRYFTLFAVPVGFILSLIGLLPIDLSESLFGALAGYGILWLTKTIFYKLRHKEGVGQGDLDLLCFIGAFTGFMGVWTSLLIGSTLGSVIGIGYMVAHKKSGDVRIPFGPFLAIGAIIYVLAAQPIMYFLLQS